MSLIVTLALLLSASFQPVSYDISCRDVRWGNTHLVEYQLDPDESILEDQAEAILGLDDVLDFNYPTIIGIKKGGC